MSTPAFPIETLGRPTSAPYSVSPSDTRVRVDTRDGLPFSYMASNAPMTRISVKWTWSLEQYAAFKAWYRDDIKDGTISFTIDEVYLDGDMGEIEARFVEPPKEDYKHWGHYTVSATLETADHDYISEATLDAALPTEPFTDNYTWPKDLFGNPTDWSVQPVDSAQRGDTDGYALADVGRKSHCSVTEYSVKWKMSQAARKLFSAWYHYKLVDGADWFWLYMEYGGVWGYKKVRFTEPVSFQYEDVDWWSITGTLETVEYNYLALADCEDLIPPSDAALPVITDQPDSVTQGIGTTVTLSVTATTAVGTLSYQWYFGTFTIDGATDSNYSFTLSGSNVGEYRVVVSNEMGSITSNVATVRVAANALLLVQVDADGNIVERTGNGTITTLGTVIVDHTITQDGYGSIRNTASGSSTVASGYTRVAANISLPGDFTIEGWWMRLVNERYTTWLSSYPATAVFQFQNWSYDTVPEVNLGGLFSSIRSVTGNAWHHFALVRSTGVASLFFDGKLAASKAHATPLSFSGLYIGNGPNSDNHPSPCCWENIRISNVALYTGSFTPPGRF